MKTWSASSPRVGAALALAALVAGYAAYGALGLLLAISVIVFWLLLQFSRTMRLMRTLAARPVGRIDGAVMLHARLRPGLRMVEVVALTRSLGVRLPHPSPGAEESWEWRDTGGDSLVIDFVQGVSTSGQVLRGAAGDAPAASAAGAGTEADTEAGTDADKEAVSAATEHPKIEDSTHTRPEGGARP